jgi:hypothetical protein
MRVFALVFPHSNVVQAEVQAEEERDMSLFMRPKFVASLAANTLVSAHAHANTATQNRASKRTAWYPAFSDQGTWSQIG